MIFNLVLYKIVFLLFCGYLCLYYYFGIAGKSLFPTGTTLFFTWQTMAFLSTITLVNLSNSSVGLQRLSMMIVGLLMFAIGAAYANREKKFQPKTGAQLFLGKPISFDANSGIYYAIIIVGMVSIVVGVLFAQKLGYSVVIKAAQNYLTTGDLSESSYIYSLGRRTVHGSEGIYLASGYSMQFIAILLPMVLYFIFARLVFIGQTFDKIIFVLMLFLNLYFLTVPGNRAYVINFFLIFFLLTTNKFGVLGKYMKSRWWTIIFPIAGLLAIFLITFISGRTGEANPLNLLAPIKDLYTRAVIVPSSDQLIFGRIFTDYEQLRWGKGWYDSLLILLPGTRETTLASKLSVLYNGDVSGSAPPDFWNSVWWNFGWLGIIIVPAILGYLLQRYAIWFYTGKKTLTTLLIVYVSFFSFREITDPIDIFQNGFVTLLILLIILSVIKYYERRMLWRKDI